MTFATTFTKINITIRFDKTKLTEHYDRATPASNNRLSLSDATHDNL